MHCGDRELRPTSPYSDLYAKPLGVGFDLGEVGPNYGCDGGVIRTSAVPSEADRLDRMFRSQVQNDVELSALVKNIPIGPRDYEETIIVDGNAWRKLTPLERERVLTKIGTHMQESLRATKPLPPQHKFSGTVYEEVLVRFGSILIRGPNDEMSYMLEK